MSWNADKSDQATNKLAGEVQLKKYGRILEEYLHKTSAFSDSLGCESFWDPAFNSIHLQTSPFEDQDIFQLLVSDNKTFNKNAAAVVATCLAATEAHQEALQLCQGLLFYGEGPLNEYSEGAVCVSRMLEPLQKLLGLVGRCGQVLETALGHLIALSAPTESKGLLFGSWTPDVNLHVLVDAIGTVLLTLITIQEVLSGCSLLRTHWSLLKRTLKAIAQETGGIQKEKLLRLQVVFHELEKKLITGDVLNSCLRLVIEPKSGSTFPASAIEQLFKYSKAEVAELELDVGSHLSWVKASAVFVLGTLLQGSADKKMFRLIWEPQKRITAVILLGSVLWLPESFFFNYLPSASQLADKRTKTAVAASRELYLQQKSQSLAKDTQVYFFIVCDWLIQMDACMRRDTTQLKLDDLHAKCAILLQGVEFLQSMGAIVRIIFNLHVHLGVPILRSSVVNLCKLVELMKNVEFMYYSKSIAIGESLNHLIQHLTYQIIAIVANAKKTLPADNKRNTRSRLEVLAALQTIEFCLQGTCSQERRLLTRVALISANQLKHISPDDTNNLKILMAKLDSVCELENRLRLAADCSFIYWHRVVLPIYFSRMLEERADLKRLKYIFATFHDCSSAMQHLQHIEKPEILQNQFKNEMFTALKLKLLDPLCQEIETDLRLRVHSHLQVKNEGGNKSGYHSMINFGPLRFFDDFLNIKDYVEKYLSATFYNLTTVALHDWNTYGDMRVIARVRYGVNTVDDHLPSQTLEQGLDVLEITRNLPSFVSNHVYNLNNQIFVELASNNKYLNTINVQHIANSIRTHGTGIINTTVNFTYQFLKKMFQSVSKFLFDARIKSRLMKELHNFQETKENTDQKYSFSRAEKFNQGIRRLGVTAEGQSLLDQCRDLVTQIGNAIGYVRMMRSGSRLYISKAISFVPDLEDVVSFEKMTREEGLPDSCIQSAKELDIMLNTLLSNFDKGIEYFKLLVEVFAPVCKDPKNSHFKLFHALVPPLTINFVEHIITCKEKLNKNVRDRAAFTDDGFAMGVAYLLKVLELDSEFDSLHWFQSVKEKYAMDKAELKEQTLKIKKGDEKLKQTLVLTDKRIETYQQEFDLLFFNLSSARIFFKGYVNEEIKTPTDLTESTERKVTEKN
ncbi:WASH complex subunit 4 [Neocloeon triangulifer]|uniref:WASH complex subunit 4 n=1 Tax=Neocloeon triangulifer TaxID=2078957 RepID=UPI00286F7282|nr:WASH complex subunit 4 [Neocloeon triangulifer]